MSKENKNYETYKFGNVPPMYPPNQPNQPEKKQNHIETFIEKNSIIIVMSVAIICLLGTLLAVLSSYKKIQTTLELREFEEKESAIIPNLKIEETAQGYVITIPKNPSSSIIAYDNDTKAYFEKTASDNLRIGVKVISIPDYYVSLGYPNGVFVHTVEEIAQNTGIVEGDIIIKADDVDITDDDDLTKLIKRHKAGDIITIVVNRKVGNKYQQLVFDVPVVAMPEE